MFSRFSVSTLKRMSSTLKGPKSLDPEEVVSRLDTHIIGQANAKRAVAVAFRNRFRRRQLSEELQKEIMPANILLKGPTGCGKTEIARRVAVLAQAPFIKVEATRYTEVGIVGANTNSMVKDLLEIAISMERKKAQDRHTDKVQQQAERQVLELLSVEYNKENVEKLRNNGYGNNQVGVPMNIINANARNSNVQQNMPGSDGEGFMDLSQFINNITRSSKKGNSESNQMMEVKEALKQYTQYFSHQMSDEQEILRNARENTEQNGIIFIDEIDKLAAASADGAGHARLHLREGVQKELLSLLEGTVVNTKHGPVSTNHILFIGSGAFHMSAISDLMPELQGRLPVRVELKALDLDDLKRILVEKKYNLIAESKALLATEGVALTFTDCAVEEIARYSFMLNNTKGNIGARRLTSVMQLVLEEISFIAHRMSGSSPTIDKKYVQDRMRNADPSSEEDLTKYIL